MTHSKPVLVTTIKKLLDAYANDSIGVPREQVEREFGELLLYLVRLAGRLDFDLIAAGEKQIARLAQTSPRLVPSRVKAPDDSNS